MIVDLSSEKFNQHLSQYSVELYGISCFSGNREASLLYATVAMVPIPPAAVNINGVKEPCSISLTHSSYALFYSDSFFR